MQGITLSRVADIPCVGGIVRDDDRRILVIRRGQAPAKGTWSLPGGRVEPGETLVDAVRREVLEETGIPVTVADLVGIVERDSESGHTYVISDFYCTPTIPGLVPVAGDDADDARWVSADELRRIDTSPGLIDALDGWGVLD